MEFSRVKNLFVIILASIVLATGVNFVSTYSDVFLASLSSSYYNIKEEKNIATNTSNKLLNPPQIIKAVYVTGWSAGSDSYLNYLSDFLDKTKVNAVVVDIKDSSGFVFYNANVDEVKQYSFYNYSIKNIDNFIKFFHDKNIYVIGRIVVFEDPMFSKNRKDLAVYDIKKTREILNPILWIDRKGLSWMDPASQEVWDYNIALAKDASLRGFDEINFDYIRFPSDGELNNMGFPIWDKKISKRETIKNFFKYAREKLPNEKISADFFGLTTISDNDLGIGQFLEDAFEYFDYVCPMVYPSHYATWFDGFENPAEHPYEVVKKSIETAYYRRQVALLKKKIKYEESRWSPASEFKSFEDISVAKIRPWLQDFNLGANYIPEMVKAEIKSTKDFTKEDYVGFMLWNPQNYYTEDLNI